MKKQIPNKFILIEGIDGSGKDTFTDYFVEELKELFEREKTNSISRIGQPFSEVAYGKQAKSFVEDFVDYDKFKTIESILKGNRLACEQYYQQYSGLFICIRGFLTDLATLKYAFPKEKQINIHGDKKIDLLVVIDVVPEIADKRIEQRGIPRTWREYKQELSYFRKFYLDFEDKNINRKLVIPATNKPHLKTMAQSLAKEIYDES